MAASLSRVVSLPSSPVAVPCGGGVGSYGQADTPPRGARRRRRRAPGSRRPRTCSRSRRARFVMAWLYQVGEPTAELYGDSRVGFRSHGSGARGPHRGGTSGSDDKVDVLGVGAGFSGLGASSLREGFDDVVVLERRRRRRDARQPLPGAACDVPSTCTPTPSPSTGWLRASRPGRSTTTSGGSARRGCELIRSHVEVTASLRPDRGAGPSHQGGGVRRSVLSRRGALCEPNYPDIEGLISRASPHRPLGPLGPAYRRRVAVIGTGASCHQVVPSVARSATWRLPAHRPWVPPDGPPLPAPERPPTARSPAPGAVRALQYASARSWWG